VRHLAWLAVALLLGAALRFHDLGGPSLWMDEGFTWMVASQPVSEMPEVATRFEKHPPLHYLAVRAALLAGGRDEFWLRFPAALAGTLTIIAIWALGMRVGGVGPLAALFLAVSGLHVLMSRDARGYGMAGLFITVACVLWLRVLERREPRVAAAWLVCGVLAAYTHYLAFFALGWMWLVGVFVLTGPDRMKWLGVPGLVALVYAPWAPIMLRQAQTPSPGHPPPAWDAFLEILFTQAAGFTLNFTPWRLPVIPPSLQPLAAWLTLIVLAAGALILAWPAGESARRVLAVFVGTVVSVFLVARFTSLGIHETKYMVLVSPLFWTLVAAGCSVPGHRVGWALAGLFLAVNLTSSLNAITQPEWSRQDFRGAIRYLAEHGRGDDLLLVTSDWAMPAVSYYLPQRMRIASLNAGQAAGFGATGLSSRVWLMRASASLSDPADEVGRRLREAGWRPTREWRTYRRNPDFAVDLKLYVR